jgi:flagellar motor switch protein FliM
MMEKLLSQEEIDALLKGIENGAVDTTQEKPRSAEVNPFDFANQDRVIRGRMPTLEILNDFLAKMLRNPLSFILRKGLEIIPQGIQLMKYGDYIRSLPIPSSLHIFKMDPLRGHSILVLDSRLAFLFVDIFLGGSGRSDFQIGGRDFTAIESRLILKVVNITLAEMEKVWHSIYPVSLQYLRSEFNPQFVSIVPPTDLVFIIPFELDCEQVTGLITLVIPYSTLEPIKASLYSGYQIENLDSDQGWIERLKNRLKSADVELVVELGKTKITAHQLLRLKVGDILSLDKEVSDPLIAKVQGVPKFSGRAGLYGSNKAFQVEGKISNF